MIFIYYWIEEQILSLTQTNIKRKKEKDNLCI